jgi:hypothetical protein
MQPITLILAQERTFGTSRTSMETTITATRSGADSPPLARPGR